LTQPSPAVQPTERHNVRDDPVAANKLNIKTDVKCDLGPSHCYPAIVCDLDFNTVSAGEDKSIKKDAAKQRIDPMPGEHPVVKSGLMLANAKSKVATTARTMQAIAGA